MDRSLYTRISLTLVGSNAERFANTIDSLRNRGLQVRVTGYIGGESMASVYRNSDVLVYPSLYEELGYAMLEAMAHGLAIIASDIPPFRDMVSHGGNGFLVEPRDPEALASYITLLANEKELLYGMKEESLRIAREKFSLQIASQKAEKLLAWAEYS